MNGIPKVVFSTTLAEGAWPGRDLAIVGSSRPTVGVLEQGLVDELRVIVTPTLLGVGPSLFSGLRERVEHELLRATTYRSGNVLLCYRPTTT